MAENLIFFLHTPIVFKHFAYCLCSYGERGRVKKISSFCVRKVWSLIDVKSNHHIISLVSHQTKTVKGKPRIGNREYK